MTSNQDSKTTNNGPPIVHMEDNDDMLVDVDNESMGSIEDSSSGNVSLAKNETRVVKIFRCTLLVLLVILAVFFSLTAYFLTQQGEIKEFETTFAGHASKIASAFKSEAAKKKVGLISLSIALSSHAEFANETWPFVTLPDWERKASVVRELADVIGVMVLPIVSDENVEAWGEYSAANQGWFWEGMEIQERVFGVNATESGVDHFDSGPLEVEGHIVQFGQNGPNSDLAELSEDSEGPYFPVWQYSPQIPVPVVNSDFRTLPTATNELNSFLEDDTRRNVVGPTFEFNDGSAGSVFINLLLERWQRGGKVYSGGPLSHYYIPVYETAEEGSPLVAVLMAFLYWQTYFAELLPEHAQGIVVVLDNSCGQSNTFSIHGSNAEWMGGGDLHESKYDHLEVATKFGEFLQRSPDVDLGGCFYRIRVYPSQEMQDDHMTTAPLTICLCMLGVFIFTVLIFVAYDRFVEKRQRLVMKTAVQSSEVVSKLFPETVRERMYDEKEPKNKASGAKAQFMSGNQTLLSSVMGVGSGSGSDTSTSTTERLQGAGKPIADEYLHCTVVFSDLAGFTNWSSTRTPTEVFTLLEALYGSFDKLAKRLGVFKIETIGDCYVAVTGLPVPQEDHALIMARFAASCIFKMNQLVNSEELLRTLGDDTAELQLRVGMHSGPVTAGVLRGEKARFQLFGDTVNTASRMESNSQKGRVQVSQATADLLILAGKQHWLTAREDLVEAKGKGKMQCYWVNLGSDPSLPRSSGVTSTVSESLTADDINNSTGLLDDNNNMALKVDEMTTLEEV